MKIKLILFFSLITNLAFAQLPDSLKLIVNFDSLVFKSIIKADSVVIALRSKYDSLYKVYQDQFVKIDSVQSRIRSKIDSLNTFQLPIHTLQKKLDSLEQFKMEKFTLLKMEANRIQSKAMNVGQAINLPPPWMEPLQKLQQTMPGYALPVMKGSLPVGQVIELPNLDHLNLSAQDGFLNDVTSSQFPSTLYDAHDLVKETRVEIMNIDKTMENKLLEMEGMEQLQEGSALIKSSSLDSTSITDKAKEILKEQVRSVVKNHFEGKQEALQKAMNEMIKLKSKYEDVQSMAELPKRSLNPLKGKPFIERLVPALIVEIQRANYLWIDLNPMLMYRFSKRISAGLGWNQRLPVDDLTIRKEERVYGPRGAVEVNWTRGINFRLLPEIMNTTIPTLMAQSKGVDLTYREWVISLFGGIKKDFTIYNKIKGFTEVLYNFYDPDGMSPYKDKLSVRIGCEFSLLGK